MSPSTAEAPAATAADARRRQRSARRHGDAASDSSAQPTPGGSASGLGQPASSSDPWPDSVANPRRTRVR